MAYLIYEILKDLIRHIARTPQEYERMIMRVVEKLKL